MYAPHHLIKSNKEPCQGRLAKPPSQGRPPSNRPRTIPKPPNDQTPNYLHVLLLLLFPIQCNFHSIPSTKNISSIPSFIKAFEEGLSRVDKFNNPSPSHLGVHNEVFQTRCFILESCHFSWLDTQSFHSIQIVQSVMPLRRCQIIIFLANFLQILSPRKIISHW